MCVCTYVIVRIWKAEITDFRVARNLISIEFSILNIVTLTYTMVDTLHIQNSSNFTIYVCMYTYKLELYWNTSTGITYLYTNLYIYTSIYCKRGNFHGKKFCGLQNFLKIWGKNFVAETVIIIIIEKLQYMWQYNGYSNFVMNQSPHFWIPTEGEILSIERETTNRFAPLAVINPQ